MSLFCTMEIIKRSQQGEYVKGRWVKGEPVEVTFKGTVQPASGRTLQLLPEGKRNSETITVFAPSNMSFTTADPATEQTADIIVWDGREYELEVVRPWKNGIISHWELVAIRKKEGAA